MCLLRNATHTVPSRVATALSLSTSKPPSNPVPSKRRKHDEVDQTVDITGDDEQSGTSAHGARGGKT